MRNEDQVSTQADKQRARASVKFTLIAALVWLSGCAMSGLGGSSKYACKAPPGVKCESVSGTYENATRRNLPGQQQRQSDVRERPTGELQRTGASIAPVRAHAMGIPAISSPALEMRGNVGTASLRSQAKVLRLWYKPWEDADRDLYDQGYVYVQVEESRWQLEHAQQRARNAFMPVRPPQPGPAPKKQAAASPTGPSASADEDPAADVAQTLRSLDRPTPLTTQ
jgi:conjugal transfer pilus assembly protein TraV